MHLTSLIAMETTASSAEYGQLFLHRFFSLSMETSKNGLFLFLLWKEKAPLPFYFPPRLFSELLLPLARALIAEAVNQDCKGGRVPFELQLSDDATCGIQVSLPGLQR